MRFRRSEGLTESEKVLADLCDNSFLKLWTYPNLFKKVAKELTDILVIFGNDVLIFSDKSCGYPDSGDAELDWSRWYNRSVSKSSYQLAQAERWVRSYPDKIFLDAKCTERLPITLPPPETMRIHRICVAIGALDRAQSETGRRALMVKPGAQNDEECFTIGAIDRAAGWVHVFDEETLKTLLTELSTAADFIHYLNSKTTLFDEGLFLFAESETDLLAYYLWHGRRFPPIKSSIWFWLVTLVRSVFRGKSHFNASFSWNCRRFPSIKMRYRLEPDLWAKVEATPAFLAGREENRISGFWDGLIEYITDLYLDESLEFGNDLAMSDYERLVRLMAGEPRFYRRILAKAILARMERARQHALSTLLPSSQADVNYVLYVGRGDQGGDHAVYRAERAENLRRRCYAAKAVRPECRWIVGIALDARGVAGASEDFILIDTAEWTPQQIHAAEQLRQALGYFIQGQVELNRILEEEYPGA